MARFECDELIVFFSLFFASVQENINLADMKRSLCGRMYDYFIYTFSYYVHSYNTMPFHWMGKLSACLNWKSFSIEFKTKKKNRRSATTTTTKTTTIVRYTHWATWIPSIVYLYALMTFPRARSIHACLRLSLSPYSSCVRVFSPCFVHCMRVCSVVEYSTNWYGIDGAA